MAYHWKLKGGSPFSSIDKDLTGLFLLLMKLMGYDFRQCSVFRTRFIIL